jgi:hypothetical protein
MRGVVATLNLSIYGPPFPVVAVSAVELQRKPYIHKTTIDEDNPQFIGTGNQGLGDYD